VAFYYKELLESTFSSCSPKLPYNFFY